MNKEELKAKKDVILALVKSGKYDEANSETEVFLDALKNDAKELEVLLKTHRQVSTDAEKILRFIDEKSRRQTAGSTADKNSVVDSLKAIDPSIKVAGPLARVSGWARRVAGNLRKPQANNTGTG